MIPTRTPDTYRSDERAVSEILGAILVFGLLLALVILIQLTAVPTWNQQVEYDHNERVQNDVGELGNAIERTQARESTESVSVELGVGYPSRPFLFNPPSAQGTLETVPRGAVQIEGAQSVGEVGDYWTGAPIEYQTRAISYSPDYNEYGDAPVTTNYEHGTVANRFSNDVTIVRQPRPVVTDNNINLIALTGDANRTGIQQTSVQVTPISRSPRTIAVTGAGGDDITISLRTTLPESAWREVMADELDGGNVELLTYTNATDPATVTLVLDGSVTYDLRTAMVGVGENLQASDPSYLERVTGGDSIVPVGTSDRFSVEVRDQFNAPKSGVNVTYEVVTGSAAFGEDPTPGDGQHTVTTNAEGQAPVVFEPSTEGDIAVAATASLNGQPGVQAEERVWFNVSTDTGADDGGDGEGDINPADSPSVAYDSFSKQGKTITLTFENLANSTREWTDIRIPFVLKQAGAPVPTDVEITPEGKNTINTGVRDGFSQITPTPLSFGGAGSPTDTRTVEVEFQGQGSNLQGGDFFVVNVRFAGGGTSTYFVGIRN